MDGGSIAGTLFIVFLVLKLTRHITWSWLWITAPLWIDAAGSALLIGILAVFGISVLGIVRRALSQRKYLL